MLKASLMAENNPNAVEKLKYTEVYLGIPKMETTTIKIHSKTKAQLDTFREYMNESYDEVITKLVYIAKHLKLEPKLSKDTIEMIEKARARVKAGHYYTEEEARKALGL